MPVPPHLHGLLDDAGPARSAPAGVDQTMLAHRTQRQAWYGDVVGSLVVSDAVLPRLAEAAATWHDARTGGLPVLVTVSGGAGALEPAVVWATRTDTLSLRGLQVTMRESDAGDLAPNARRIVAAVDALLASGTLDEDIAVYVEPPPPSAVGPSPSWLSALDELAAVDHRLTLRAHGATDGGLSSGQLAVCIDAALDRELRFRCTGVRRALRHPDQQTGEDRPGFLNLLLATRAGLDGAARADLAALLEETDEQVLTAGADEAAMASAHRWCTSFETDDVAGSLRDLVHLGWLGEP